MPSEGEGRREKGEGRPSPPPVNERVEDLLYALDRDRFAGSVLRGGLPRVPVRESLPTASEEYAYRMVAIPGTPDVVFVCLRNAGGTWGWRTAATG